MSSLTRFEKNGIELVINTETGEAFATISGYARMQGKAQSTISERVEKLYWKTEIKTAELNTGYGFKLYRLILAQIVGEWAIDDVLMQS